MGVNAASPWSQLFPFREAAHESLLFPCQNDFTPEGSCYAVWALASSGPSLPWGPLSQSRQATQLQHDTLHKVSTEMEGKSVPQPSH